MAKKTKAAPNPDELREEVEQTVEVQEVVKDERTTKVVGILLLAAAFLLFVAIASYCATWSEDQDKVLQFGVKLLATNDVRMSNQMGALGAYVSHHLVYNGFGLASFLFCSLFFVFGVNKFFGQKVFSPARTLRYITVGLVIISMSFSFLTKGASFAYGGAVGDYLNSWLEKWIGRFGTGTLILLGLASYGIWRFNPTFTWPKWERKANNIQPEEDEMIFPTAPAPVALTTEEPAETNVPPAEQGSGFTPSMNTAVTPIHLSHIQPSEEPTPVVLNYFEKQEEPLEPSPKPIESFEQEIPLSVDLPTEAASALLVTPTPLVHVQMPATANAEAAMLDTYEPDEDDFVDDDEDDFIPAEIAPHNQLTLEIKEVPEEPEEIPVAPAAVGSLATNYDPTLDLGNYKHPHAELLETHGSEKIVHDAEELEGNKNQIIATLKNYSIDIQRISATVGPTVTLYEIVPAPGVRISKIKNLEDDIALSLSALGIRIIAPIPGKGTIGIEVPNVRKTVVSMKTLLSSEKFLNSTYSLPIAIGKKIDNENFIVDLATMPHLLVAGATGQGKSVGINALLVSLLFKKHPSQLKFVLVDPKKVELSLYRVIEKHFLAKLPNEEESIITDTKKVINTLNALCIEMDNRYDLLKDAGCRTIKEYNEKFLKRRLNPQKGHQFLPFIVLVVDEFADLIMTAGKEVEMPIARLAQLARAVGIHLIIATQRPSVNIITGTIKANFPARIAFKVSSKIDSRTILDAGGAEQLIGKGDMLVSYNGEITRLQCAFVDTPEVERVCEFIGDQQGYPDAFLLPEYVDEKEAGANGDFDVNDKDPLFEDAARLIVQNQVGSTSLIQRRMKLGYNRAGRLMDQLEHAGIVGPNQGSKAREVLFKTEADLQQWIDSML